MAHAFNGHTLRQFIGDTERLLASTHLQERELTMLAGLTAKAPGAIDSVVTSVLGDAVARLRLAAGEQRGCLEAILARLIGDRSEDGAVHTRPRLLIVDDSDSSREITAAILEDAGFTVFTATNGLEAVIAAHYVRPSLILMDLTMPVLDGAEAARLIRASTATQDLKVVAYSARPDLFDGAITKYFVGAIRKPASPDAIVALVRRMVTTQPQV